MTLSDKFKRDGEWLFRWRSYLPLLLAPFFLMALWDFSYPWGSHRLDVLWRIFCLAVSLTGLAVRVLAVGRVPFGTSGRNTSGQVARVLNTTGMYSIVRHPLYLGNFLIWLGITLYFRQLWFILIILAIFWLFYERIIYVEEGYLKEKFGEAFEDWANNTPTFLPNFKKWKPADLPFSLKTVLRREYSTFFAIVAIFAAINGATELILHRRLGLDFFWVVVFGFSLIFYLVVRVMKKRTTWLQVEGR